MQGNDTRSLVEQDDVSDRAIIDALIDDPGPWALDDLKREFLNPLAVEDSLARLVGVGMVHRIGDGFVFASRTAKQAAAIFEG